MEFLLHLALLLLPLLLLLLFPLLSLLLLLLLLLQPLLLLLLQLLFVWPFGSRFLLLVVSAERGENRENLLVLRMCEGESWQYIYILKRN